jgi:hypothetical protein
MIEFRWLEFRPGGETNSHPSAVLNKETRMYRVLQIRTSVFDGWKDIPIVSD